LLPADLAHGENRRIHRRFEVFAADHLVEIGEFRQRREGREPALGELRV